MTGVQAAALSGSALILLVTLLRAAFGQYLPRRIFPALWCVAALRLLLPVSIPSRLSIWALLARGRASASGVISEAAAAFPALIASAPAGAAQSAGLSRPSPAFILWALAAALLAIYFAAGYIWMTRRLRGARIAPQPAVDRLLDLFSFRKDPRICATKSPRAPLTFGIFHPTVLLPEGLSADDARFSLVLAHELAHIRRKDCPRKLLLTACLCLYWWNPLIWLMTILANRDMELACDEAVLCALGPGCKKAYALTLLDMASRGPKPLPLSSGFAKSSAEARIRAILNFRRLPAWTGICAAVFFLLSASVLATQAPRTPAPKPVVVQTAQSAPAEKRAESAAPEASAQAAPQQVSAEIPLEESPEQTPAEAPAEEMPAQTPAYIFPLEDTDAPVTDVYGWREHPLFQNGKTYFHSGVDLAAEAGSSILAVADGTVVESGYNEAYGYMVILAHTGGLQTFYAHMTNYLVSAGDTVQQGQIIGTVGSTGWATGPHLHLGVMIDGESVDPLAALQSAS